MTSVSIASALQRGDRHRRRALAAPDEAHPLARRRLDVDAPRVNVERLGEPRAHRLAVRGDLRRSKAMVAATVANARASPPTSPAAGRRGAVESAARPRSAVSG